LENYGESIYTTTGMQRYDNKSERLYKMTFRDFSIFTKIARAAYQVKSRITGFIENRMHVKAFTN